MLDFRMKTFLQLCEMMNYRKTAQALNMTQPSVTQHIQFLEKEYGCKLFMFDGHKLFKTEKCHQLEQKTRSMFYLEQEIREQINCEEAHSLRIGATKTIAEFILPSAVKGYLQQNTGDFCLVVENTEMLLKMLDDINLDFAVIEGAFDKSRYGSRLFRKESFVGFCNVGHPFAGKEVTIDELFLETLIVREEGSGTRTILEEVLRSSSHSFVSFKRVVCISQFSVIKQLVTAGIGISFGFASVALSKDTKMEIFRVKDMPIVRELNYVYLKGTENYNYLKKFEKYIQ